MAKVSSDSSISDAQAREFVRTKPDRAVKTCKKITGFQLMKVGAGASWRYRYTDDHGKRRVITVGNYPTMKADEAAQKAMAWRNQRSDPLADARRRKVAARSAEQVSASRTLGAYLNGIYTEHQARKKNGGKHTLDMIRHHFADLLDRDMVAICKADITAWQQKREKELLAHVTLQRAYGALRTLLNHAVAEEVISSNPIAKVKLLEPTSDETAKALSAGARAHRRMLTDEELSGLNKGIQLFAEEIREQRRSSRKHGRAYLPDFDLLIYPHWFIPFFYLGLHTGMRPGDLYTLTWQELNLNFRRLVKMPEKTLHLRNPAMLDLPITDGLYGVMAPWHAQQGSPAVGLVFPSTSKKKKAADMEGNGKPFGKQAHDAAWARVLALGGVDPNLHFYSLRHHFISALVANGAPLLSVAKLVGHKSTAMIEKHYGHLAKNAATDLMRTFSEALQVEQAVDRVAAC